MKPLHASHLYFSPRPLTKQKNNNLVKAVPWGRAHTSLGTTPNLPPPSSPRFSYSPFLHINFVRRTSSILCSSHPPLTPPAGAVLSSMTCPQRGPDAVVVACLLSGHVFTLSVPSVPRDSSLPSCWALTCPSVARRCPPCSVSLICSVLLNSFHS